MLLATCGEVDAHVGPEKNLRDVGKLCLIETALKVQRKF